MERDAAALIEHKLSLRTVGLEELQVASKSLLGDVQG